MVFQPGGIYPVAHPISPSLVKFLRRMGTFEAKPYWCWRGRRWKVVSVNPFYEEVMSDNMSKAQAKAMCKLLTTVNTGA